MELDWPALGREDLLRAVRSEFADGDAAGVVLAGAPGVGKTRLARLVLDALA